MIAESAPRARMFWVAAGLAAAITMAAIARPVVVVVDATPRVTRGIHQIGRCGKGRPPIAAPQAAPDPVPTIRVLDAGDRVITVHPRPPTMVGDLQITY